MKKLFYFATCGLIFITTACSGGAGGKEQKAQTFAEAFAGYVNANQLDSIKAVYPTLNFDSIAPVATDSITINEVDGTTRIDFGGGKWIEVTEGEAGDVTVVNSKGIAVFPEDKLQLALNTGMLTPEVTDVKSQELLNDSTYFDWLSKKSNSGDCVIQIKPGKLKSTYRGEAQKGSMTVTLTNLSDSPISRSDYTIAYKTNESNGYTDNSRRNYTKNNTHKGIDLKPNGSGTIDLSKWETYKFYNFEVKPVKGKESAIKKQSDFTGKEYQEYLDSKK